MTWQHARLSISSPMGDTEVITVRGVPDARSGARLLRLIDARLSPLAVWRDEVRHGIVGLTAIEAATGALSEPKRFVAATRTRSGSPAAGRAQCADRGAWPARPAGMSCTRARAVVRGRQEAAAEWVGGTRCPYTPPLGA